jgi:hypothetical protein
MAELSQTLKNFLVLWESEVLPKIQEGYGGDSNRKSMVVTISSTAMHDPQMQELLGISPGNKTGRFMGVIVKTKPDMEVELYG